MKTENHSTLLNSLTLASIVLLSVICNRYCDADWPQILGPGRNGEAINETPISIWNDEGPQVSWTYDIGQGYAGPVVTGDQVIVFHRMGDIERVESLDVQSGKPQWQADFEATYTGGIDPDKGPRCVPLIYGSRVYAFGAAGNLHCLDLTNGKKIWSKSTHKEFEGRDGYFGTGSTPIVADKKLIVNVGGREGGLVAFDLESGKTIWKTTQEQASYSSPTAATIDGVEHVVFVTRLNTVSINPANGDVRFQFPFGRKGPTVNGATPLLIEDRLFVSASYGVGARLSRIKAGEAEKVWANDDVMSSQYSTCVHRNGYLYGTHGREDYNNGEYRCVELATGKIQWQQTDFAISHTILVGDRLLLLGVDGILRLVKAAPKEYQELGSSQVSKNLTRALPALSNGKFYFRDNDGRNGKLVCLDLSRQNDEEQPK
jgi:outer membrane protein assembly factor BamB